MNAYLNGQPCELAEGATLATALVQLDVNQSTLGVAAAVNGEVVPAARWGSYLLSEGARIEVVRAIQGG